jgi:hypothetical protein
VNRFFFVFCPHFIFCDPSATQGTQGVQAHARKRREGQTGRERCVFFSFSFSFSPLPRSLAPPARTPLQQAPARHAHAHVLTRTHTHTHTYTHTHTHTHNGRRRATHRRPAFRPEDTRHLPLFPHAMPLLTLGRAAATLQRPSAPPRRPAARSLAPRPCRGAALRVRAAVDPLGGEGKLVSMRVGGGERERVYACGGPHWGGAGRGRPRHSRAAPLPGSPPPRFFRT